MLFKKNIITVLKFPEPSLATIIASFGSLFCGKLYVYCMIYIRNMDNKV